MIKYLLPGHPNGDKHIIQACKTTHGILSPFYFEKIPLSLNKKLTYGYLGKIAASAISKEKSNISFLGRTYILDHAFCPPELRNNLYRVMRLSNSGIELFPLGRESLVSSFHQNKIFSYIKEIQQQNSIELFLIKQHGTSKPSIYIKPSPVLLALADQSNRCDLFEQEYHAFLRTYNLTAWAYCAKQNEVYLSDNGLSLYRTNSGFKQTIEYPQIPFVYCPSSLLAFSFVLHSIPVVVSRLHPYHMSMPGLVEFNPSDAIDFVYDLVLKSSVSVECLRSLEKLIAAQSF